MHMISLWQQRSRIPTTAKCYALYEAAPILDYGGQKMLAVCDHYMLHRNDLKRAFEADDLFFHTDRANTSRINGWCSAYNLGSILNDVYCIYCTGSPFESLFCEARRQLDDAILKLGYEQKEREFKKAWIHCLMTTTSLRVTAGCKLRFWILRTNWTRWRKGVQQSGGKCELRYVTANKEYTSWQSNFHYAGGGRPDGAVNTLRWLRTN